LKPKIVIDTSVVIEYLDRSGAWHRFAAAIFDSIIQGKVIAYIPVIVLSEILYVSKRLYEKIGKANPKRKAIKLLRWLYRNPNIIIVRGGLRLAVLSGLIKSKYRLALSDCYVLALAKLLKAKPIFRKREREMLDYIDTLRKIYNVVFLEDYQ